MRKSLLNLSLLIGLVSMAPIAVGKDLETIKERGKLIIGVKDNLQPLGFYDSQGKLQGLEIDIAKRLAEEIFGDRTAVILKPVSNEDRLKLVVDGKVDLTIAVVVNTPSRLRMVDFSEPYYINSIGFITKNNKITQIKQLASSKILVLKNSATIAEVRYVLPHAEIIGVNSYQEAKEALETNKGEVFAGDRAVLAGWQQQTPEYHILQETIGGQALCIALPKSNSNADLLVKINQAIREWRRSGWLRERANYWGLP